MKEDVMVQIFEDMGGDLYDQNNASFKTVTDNIQTLNKLILKDLAHDARILSVGIGTGADIIELGERNPGWSFVGVEPAKAMLDKCESKLADKGLLERCTLVHGYLEDLDSTEQFDAVLCLFVMHFIKDMQKRAQMIASFSDRLKEGGILIQTEISVDTKSREYGQLIENWKATHSLTGASEEKLEKIPNSIEEVLGVISPLRTTKLLEENGFENPVQFFQVFLIRGWYARKK
jgi:tRNA (cmo5U34)-methyltransferase